ncbi:PST family polysaccharide transporter [Parabacteroides sp. PM5-20]|nr:PST family polysaccharide transporter [Parabacteroides sp. PM5-20]
MKQMKLGLSKLMITNFFSLVTLQGVNFLLQFITFPFLFRTLGVEHWGIVSAGYTLIQYFIIFTDFGFNLSGTKYISQHRNNTEKINSYLNSAMIGRLLFGILSFIILSALIGIVPKFSNNPGFYLLFFGMVIGNVMFPMWFFQGMESMKYITLINVITKGISCICFFLFIRGSQDYLLVPVFYSAGYIASGIVSLYLIYRKMKMRFFFPAFKQIKYAVVDSSSYFLSRASIALTSSNTLILSFVCGDTAAGYYAAAEKIYQAYNQLIGPVTGVLFPHMAKTRDVPFFKRILKYISAGNVALVIFIFLLATPIFHIIYKDPGLSTDIFRIFSIGCLVTIPSMLVGYPFLAAMGHPLYTNWTVMCMSIFHIAGLSILYFFNVLNMYTVAMMVVVSETFLFALRIRGIIQFKLFSSPQS